MIYPELATYVLLAAFLVISTVSSLASVAAWLALRSNRFASVPRPFAVFQMRVVPTAFAAIVTMTCVFPAFHMFEPRGAEEDVGWVLSVMALLALTTLKLR